MNEVANVENNELATQPQFEEFVRKDITIPRILLSQAMSDRVKEKIVHSGEYVLTGSDTLIAKEGEEFKLIPLMLRSVWVNYSLETKRGKFRGTEPRTNSNADWPWTFELDGIPYKRVQGVELYGLLPSQILAYQEAIKKATDLGEIPDLTDVITPVGMSFQSSSFKYAGKSLIDFFTRVKTAKMSIPTLQPYFYTVSLKSDIESGEEGDYFVSKLVTSTQVSKTYTPTEKEILFAEAGKWMRRIQSMNVSLQAEDDPNPGSTVQSDLV